MSRKVFFMASFSSLFLRLKMMGLRKSEDHVGDAHQRVPFQRLGTLVLEVDDRGKAVVHDHQGEVESRSAKMRGMVAKM